MLWERYQIQFVPLSIPITHTSHLNAPPFAEVALWKIIRLIPSFFCSCFALFFSFFCFLLLAMLLELFIFFSVSELFQFWGALLRIRSKRLLASLVCKVLRILFVFGQFALLLYCVAFTSSTSRTICHTKFNFYSVTHEHLEKTWFVCREICVPCAIEHSLCALNRLNSIGRRKTADFICVLCLFCCAFLSPVSVRIQFRCLVG